MFLGNPMMMRKLASGPNIANLFATTLYTGNGTTNTVTTGIDLAGKGGLAWIKQRSGSASSHMLYDTARGAGFFLRSDTTDDSGYAGAYDLTGFTSSGLTLNQPSTSSRSTNGNGETYVAWSFARAARFFDVVTYTGDGGSNRSISHSLGTTPGLIIVKCADNTTSWKVYHRSLSSGDLLELDSSLAAQTQGYFPSAPDSSTFSVSATPGSATNTNIRNYVAYLFAHDTAADGVVQCGSYTGNGSTTGPTITLGWQPQWLLIKNASSSGDVWVMFDTVRGQTGSNDYFLMADNSGAEASDSTVRVDYNGAGFQITGHSSAINGNGNTLVYIAIRAAA